MAHEGTGAGRPAGTRSPGRPGPRRRPPPRSRRRRRRRLASRPPWPPSTSSRSPSPTATSRRSTTCRSAPRRARSPACSGPTAPARPRPSRRSRDCAGPASGRLSVVGLDPHADHRALTERIGVMLQEGGIHPALRPPEVLRHAAALYRQPLDPAALLDRLGLAGLERRTYRQLSGRRAAAAGAGAGAGRPAPGGVPRRAHRGRRPRRPPGHPPGHRRAAQRRASPSCSPPTTSTRPSGWPTGWSSSTGGRLVADGTVAELIAGRGRGRPGAVRAARRGSTRPRCPSHLGGTRA